MCVTFVGTRFALEIPVSCNQGGMSYGASLSPGSGLYRDYGSLAGVFRQRSGWPERGYGTQLNLRIYVYETKEIDGLQELLSGRDHSIDFSACVKGQWGTQV